MLKENGGDDAGSFYAYPTKGQGKREAKDNNDINL